MHKLLGVAAGWLLATAVYGHESPLDAHGCHYDQNRGGYHCHKGTFAGHYFESREDMLLLLQLDMSEPRPPAEAEVDPDTADETDVEHVSD